MNHFYGWKPDLPDHRDYAFAEHVDTTKALPSSVDLEPLCTPVKDQGALGSCVLNALAGHDEVNEQINGIKPVVILSRLFMYYNTRVIEGTVRQDSGCMVRDAIKSLVKTGVCAEVLWPYVISKFTNKPTAKTYTDAVPREAQVYAQLNTLADMKTRLASGRSFIGGFSVYESFESEQVAKTGIVNLPEKGEQLLGGHGVHTIGYDDATGRFKVRNSWGAAWGIRGCFTIPYEYWTNRNLSDDFWVVLK
jgi:C1A family cysteine protease